MNKEQCVDILLIIAEGATYESEYDGFCDTYCCYCHANLSHRVHDNRCLMIQAREAVKDEWLSLVSKKEKEARQAYERTWDYRVEKIPCANCGKPVKRIGMNQHVKDSGCGLIKSPGVDE